ncbi:hypothetical protein CERZMDRAFT_85037 [Cercospora zeae-maydis SCOH1-5]|uniref:Uncharacterized protein n=1 Tax=Cercospora zeae-maydis SCOH1-5 TaxID=717836 RepID=A0A6A6FFC2_9PEZI|nr:hypothetical protein CERZMDRAFT_85037 [Cercospora zeae-maydis SCOH1-5]
MAATGVRPRVANGVGNPLRLHPPSPTEQRTSQGRIDSIIDSYAMDRSSSEPWDAGSSLGSFIDDRCPTEWEHPRPSKSAERALSSPRPDSRRAPRPINSRNPTDELRTSPIGVSERPATRESNALHNPALTALPQSLAAESPRPVKTKALDATLLRKLFRATIDEKRKIDEARRQTAQDASAKVASKAGAEARSRRVAPPILTQDQQVLRGIRQSHDHHAQSLGSEQPPSVSELKLEYSKPRVPKDPALAVVSSDSPPSKLPGRKLSFDRPHLLRGGSKSEQESETGVFLTVPAFGSGASKGCGLSLTREDPADYPPSKPVAREARTKDRESGLEALQKFLRDTGPVGHKSKPAKKKKTSKLTKHQKKESPTVAHHELRRNRNLAAAAEILLSPTGDVVSQLAPPQLACPQTSSNAHHLEAQNERESRSSKRIADRARWQAEVESARSISSSKISAGVVERPSMQYSRSVSIDIVRTVPKPPSTRRPSRPVSSHYSRPSGFYGGKAPLEKEQSKEEFGEIELGWTAAADEAEMLAPTSRHSVEQSEDAPEASPTAKFHPASSRGSAKRSARQPTPKLALKIPKSTSVSVDWEEVSFAQNVVYQTLIPVSASKVTIPRSAGSKSPSIANFEPIAEELDLEDFDLEDLERQRHARERTGSEVTAEAGSDTPTCEKPPMQRKDSKSSSDVVWSEDECEAPPVRNDSNWFRDWKSAMPQAFEFEGLNSSQAKAPARRTPQAASPEIQSVVDGWVEDARESRSLKFAAAKQVMRTSSSPCISPASREQTARPETPLGSRDDNERSQYAESPVELRGRSKSSKSITAAGQLRRLPSRKSRSIASTKGSAAVAVGTFEEVGRASHADADPHANAWAAASARSTKVPIRSMSFKPVSRRRATSHASSRALSHTSSRALSHASSRALSQAVSARSTTFLQHESNEHNSSPGTAPQSCAQAQKQSVEPWPGNEEQCHTPTSTVSAPVASRRSLASTPRSRKIPGSSLQSHRSGKSGAVSHRFSNAPHTRSVRDDDDDDIANEPPVPPPHESPLYGRYGMQAKPELTIFAGKGWISPHPLSRSSTEHASPPQSRIILPGDAFPVGATMTYEEWKQMQEHGLRFRHNHSVTESSRTRHGLYQDDRFRHAAWEGRESTQTNNWQPNQSHWSGRSSRQEDDRASEKPSLVAAGAQRSQGSGVSFVTESRMGSGGSARKHLSQQQLDASASGTQSLRGQKLEDSSSSRHSRHDGESSFRREHGRRSHRSQRSERTRKTSDSHYTRYSERSGKTIRSSRSKRSGEIEQAWDEAERGNAGRALSEKNSTRSSRSRRSEKIEQAWDDAERGNAGYYVPPQYDVNPGRLAIPDFYFLLIVLSDLVLFLASKRTWCDHKSVSPALFLNRDPTIRVHDSMCKAEAEERQVGRRRNGGGQGQQAEADRLSPKLIDAHACSVLIRAEDGG